jgi:hypothetical protein
MFGEFSTKELLLWIAGLLVTAVIVIVGAIYVVNNILAPHDASDPLTNQGGLDQKQDLKQK